MPLRDGRWTPAALAQARIVARMRQRGHDLDQLRRAAKEGRLAYGYLEDLFPQPERGVRARRRRPRDPSRAGADPPDLDRRGLQRRLARASLRGRHRAAAPARRRARRRAPARRLPADRARVRDGAGADRRRRGQALPPLRPRADDPRRRARARHRRGALGPRQRAAAAVRPDHGVDPPAAAPALPRAGRRRAPRARRRRGRARPRAGGDRVRRPRGLHAADRGDRARRRRSRSSSASSSWSARRCPTTRAWSRRSATR